MRTQKMVLGLALLAVVACGGAAVSVHGTPTAMPDTSDAVGVATSSLLSAGTHKYNSHQDTFRSFYEDSTTVHQYNPGESAVWQFSGIHVEVSSRSDGRWNVLTNYIDGDSHTLNCSFVMISQTNVQPGPSVPWDGTVGGLMPSWFPTDQTAKFSTNGGAPAQLLRLQQGGDSTIGLCIDYAVQPIRYFTVDGAMMVIPTYGTVIGDRTAYMEIAWRSGAIYRRGYYTLIPGA